MAEPLAENMKSPQQKFQHLLRELFQFDVADLDFGIYRIMNHKRQVIERFISEDLPQAIAKELQQGVLVEPSQAAKELEAARKKVLEALGEDALDADGNLTEAYRATKAGREYLAAHEKAKAAKSSEALEAAIYNHLYAFFSRYWQDGTLSPSGATPRRSATPFPTMAKRCISTGQVFLGKRGVHLVLKRIRYPRQTH